MRKRSFFYSTPDLLSKILRRTSLLWTKTFRKSSSSYDALACGLRLAALWNLEARCGAGKGSKIRGSRLVKVKDRSRLAKTDARWFEVSCRSAIQFPVSSPESLSHSGSFPLSRTVRCYFHLEYPRDFRQSDIFGIFTISISDGIFFQSVHTMHIARYLRITENMRVATCKRTCFMVCTALPSNSTRC